MENVEHYRTYLNRLIDFCSAEQLNPIILALPQPQPEEDLLMLLENPQINGVINGEGIKDNDSLTCFAPDDYTWEMPAKRAKTIACLGARTLFSFHMIRAAFHRKVKWLVYATPSGFHRERITVFLLVRLLGTIYRRAIPPRLAKRLERITKPVVRALNPMSLRDRVVESLRNPRLRRDLEYVMGGPETPLLEADAFVPGRIVLINRSLYPDENGKDVVNTLLGLVHQGYTDLTLLCESLGHELHHDFLLSSLADKPIEVAEILSRASAAEHQQPDDVMIDRARNALRRLPADLAEEIFTIVCELVRQRPDVVHIWQDAANIKCGIAAALVGVPKIVMTVSNLASDRFADSQQYYFWRGYQVLLKHPDVDIISRSRVGKNDYDRWLGLPDTRIRVVPSPPDNEVLAEISSDETSTYRKQLGIADHVPVIGSLIKFFDQKDSLLLVDTIREVALARPDAVFLLVGGGPMLNWLKRATRCEAFADRLFTPGLVTDPVLPLRLLDVFLLPAKRETVAHDVFEARRRGIQVVCADEDGILDELGVGNSGWVIRSRNPGAIAERVVFLLNSREWNEWTAHGADRFDMTRITEQTLGVYGYPPRLAPVNFKVGRRSQQALREEVDYAINVGNSYSKRLESAGADLENCRILELGPGINYGAMMILSCHGAVPAIADRFPAAWSVDYHPAFYALLAEVLKQNQPALDVSKIQALAATNGYPEELLTVFPTGAEEMNGVADGAFDVTLSNAVFEHLHSPARAFRELGRITRPGGLGFHQVDFRDHNDFSQPLEYLLHDPHAFERFFRLKLGECGRQYRPGEIEKMFEHAGFAVTEYEPNLYADDAYLAEFVPRLRKAKRSRYRNYDVADLKVLGAHFTIVKGA